METEEIKKRLTELNTKAYYLLVALSFVYRTNPTISVKLAFTLTALVAVLPLQDWFKSNRALANVRRFKVGALSFALIFTLVWVWCTIPPSKAESPVSTAALLVPASPAAVPQQLTTAQPTQAQLEERIKELEKRVNDAEQKAATAAMEKDYITRVQSQYERYYEKVLDTQKWTLGIMGLIITIVLAVASRYSLTIFDSRTKNALDAASAQIEQKFSEKMQAELESLRKQNVDQLRLVEDGLKNEVKAQTSNLEIRSEYQFRFLQGLSLGAANQFEFATDEFRGALEVIVNNPDVFNKGIGRSAIANLFNAISHAHPKQFVEEAKKELQNEIYKGLHDELAYAAIEYPDLRPLIHKL